MTHLTRSCVVRSAGLALLAWGIDLASAGAQNAAAVPALLDSGTVRSALELVKSSEPQTLEEGVRFCEVPAPPFQEAARAALVRRAFASAGLSNVRVDRAGNVLGEWGGAAAPRLVMAAHLDTVFPEGTAVKVKREGSVFRGPGIGDNCRGLAVLVAVAKAIVQSGFRPAGSITFVANVGEEGLGDLRGTKALFDDTMKGQIDRFVAIDGPGLLLVTQSVGSRRYRISFKGPGGHSYGSFGLPSPIGALGRAVAKINDLHVSDTPRTTFNVGRIGGGTSVNAIASEAWMEIDLRSEDSSSLSALEAQVQRAIEAGVAEENARWGTPGIVTFSSEVVGNRPGGSIELSAPIVQTALAVARALELRVAISAGSTDANIPVSLKIPAIAIGAGGRSAGAHTLDESFDSANSWQGSQNALLLAIALSQ